MAKHLVHTLDNYSLNTENMTQDEVLVKLKEDGYSMGKTSYYALVKGERDVACGFRVEEVADEKQSELELAPVEAKVPAVETVNEVEMPMVEGVEVAGEIVDAEIVDEEVPNSWMQLAGAGKPKTKEAPNVVINQTVIKQEVKVNVVQQTNITINGNVVVVALMPVKKDSKMAKVMEMIARPDGASMKEMIDELGWSESGVGSVLHYYPKERGYRVFRVKVGTVSRYHLYIGDAKITSEQILYK